MKLYISTAASRAGLAGNETLKWLSSLPILMQVILVVRV